MQTAQLGLISLAVYHAGSLYTRGDHPHRWLVKKHKDQKAMQVLMKLRRSDKEGVEEELEEIQATVSENGKGNCWQMWQAFFNWKILQRLVKYGEYIAPCILYNLVILIYLVYFTCIYSILYLYIQYRKSVYLVYIQYRKSV